MKKLALICTIAVLSVVMAGGALAVAGHLGGERLAPAATQSAPEGAPQAAPTNTESDLINESNEIVNDPNMDARSKQEAICDEMRAQGAFDGTGVKPAEVGC